MFNRRQLTKNYNVYELIKDLKDNNENIKKIERIYNNKIEEKKDEPIEMSYIDKNKINIPKKLKVIGKIS
jgi:hypothetical protein